MPMLATQIVDNNAALSEDSDDYLNFKGFAVGNPATTFYSAIPASLDVSPLSNHTPFKYSKCHCLSDFLGSSIGCEAYLGHIYIRVQRQTPSECKIDSILFILHSFNISISCRYLNARFSLRRCISKSPRTWIPTPLTIQSARRTAQRSMDDLR